MADSQKTPSRARRAMPPANGIKGKVLYWLKWLGITILTLSVLGIGAFIVGYFVTPIPDPNKDFQTNNTVVYYRDGTTEISAFSVQNRSSIPLDEMPASIKDAIVAAENQSFWDDPGIDVVGLTRAVFSLFSTEQTVGGSTITQQYVKLLYLNQEKTFTRKAKEIVLALKVGQDLSKEQILEGYLNTVYFGRGTYGIQAASQTYFKKDAKDLTLSESVAMASIINAPALLDPASSPKHASDLLERYQYTLNSMETMGKITAEQKAAIYGQLPTFPERTYDSRLGGPKGFLMGMVKDELLTLGYSEAEIEGGGLKVTTTFDVKMQEAAVKAAQDMTNRAAGEHRKDPAGLHAAIASIDNATGGVLALYGGPDYVKDSRNWATTPRPTGSTFKAWALVAALRHGFPLSATFNGSDVRDGGSVVRGRSGPITMLSATTNSSNPAYVDIVRQIPDGADKVVRAAVDVGIPEHSSWTRTNRIALGYPEASPVDQAFGLSTLANMGMRQTRHVVTEVKNATGKTVYTFNAKPTQAIEPAIAQNAVYALTNVTASGTGRRVSALGHQVAGKTGTRYDSGETKASWFIGATKQISTAVMFVAGPQGNSDLDAYSYGFYGSGYPAATWLAYMRVAMDGIPRERFPGATTMPYVQQPSRLATPRPSDSADPSASPSPTSDPSETDIPEEPEAPEPSEPAKPTVPAKPTAPAKPTVSTVPKKPGNNPNRGER